MLLISFHLRLYRVICALFPAAFWASLRKCMYMLRCGVGLNPSYATIGNSLNFSNPVSLTIKWEYSYVTPWGCCMGGLNETESVERLAWWWCLAHSGPHTCLIDWQSKKPWKLTPVLLLSPAPAFFIYSSLSLDLCKHFFLLLETGRKANVFMPRETREMWGAQGQGLTLWGFPVPAFLLSWSLFMAESQLSPGGESCLCLVWS